MKIAKRRKKGEKRQICSDGEKRMHETSMQTRIAADARPGQARRVNAMQRNGPFRGRNYLNYQINGGWSFFIGQFSAGRVWNTGRAARQQSYTRTSQRTNERPGFSAKRENATAFLISYCVLTCHTCDHAMQYRGLEFLFSAPGPFDTPLLPSHEGPGRVGVGSCAFQIMRSRVHQPRLRYEHYARSRYR